MRSIRQLFTPKNTYVHSIITPYFFGPSQLKEYSDNLNYLDEQGACIVHSSWNDLNGGVIEVMTVKHQRR